MTDKKVKRHILVFASLLFEEALSKTAHIWDESDKSAFSEFESDVKTAAG